MNCKNTDNIIEELCENLKKQGWIVLPEAIRTVIMTFV